MLNRNVGDYLSKIGRLFSIFDCYL